MKTYFLLLLGFVLLTSCESKPKPSVQGLWQVTTVTAGENEMTPNARWVRFHSNFTQESGNGWFQHSIGTWNLNETTKELSIVNSNGLKDSNDPFKITIHENIMTWSREEEGQALTVHLKRIETLPTTYGDQLLGLWKLENAVGKGDYFDSSKIANASFYLGWDKRFLIQTGKTRIRGIYNVHGHKPEVQLIPYNEEKSHSFWNIQFEENSITLKLLNSDSLVMRTFKRIHEFPK
ncbi:hypothetical protein [Kordia sp.]|uniref:hypothetical protein n=1 Tax=Kordia sp. TaxID=1965332 RepID=UPI003B5994E7